MEWWQGILFVSAGLIACGGNSTTNGDPPPAGVSGASNGGSSNSGSSNGGSGNGGGRSGDAGASASGGMGNSAGSAVQDPVSGDCGPGVTFRLSSSEAEEGTGFCLGEPGICNGNSWLSILDAQLNLVPLVHCALTLCSSCEHGACPAICIGSGPLPAEGSETTWDGITWVDSTCAGGACQQPVCAPVAEYVARFCGYPFEVSGEGGSSSVANPCDEESTVEPVCVDVPFAYPGEELVTAELTPIP